MKRITSLLIILIFVACSKDDSPLDKPIDKVPVTTSDEIITIPIVVHVVNNINKPFEISDQKIQSQITVLNNDFRMKNEDHTKTPEEFKPLVADVGIEFKLATVDPDGNPTKGIIRSESELTGFHGFGFSNEIEELPLHFDDKGGQDA